MAAAGAGLQLVVREPVAEIDHALQARTGRYHDSIGRPAHLGQIEGGLVELASQ